jgi:hypothetical protein
VCVGHTLFLSCEPSQEYSGMCKCAHKRTKEPNVAKEILEMHI